MRQSRPVILMSLLMCLAGGLAHVACTAEDSRSAQVDALFSAVGHDSPGGAVLVAERGTILYSQGYGWADVEGRRPMTPTTRVCIASITKQFTGTAILILARQGKLDLDSPVQLYLPDFSHAAVTVRQLATHTSGLPDFVTYEEAMELPLDAAPGDRLNYSNTGYTALGRLIKQVSGQSYLTFLQDNIFKPLGMSNSGLDAPETVAMRARGYLFDGSGYHPIPDESVAGAFSAGGLYSTVEDLFRWDQAWFDDRLLDARYREIGMSSFRLNDGRNAPYGFGWMLSEFRGLREVGHGGDLPGFNSYIARYPEQQFTVIVLSNVGMRPPGPLPSASDLAHRIAEIYLEDRLAPERPPLSIEVDPAILQSYAGRFRLDAPPTIVQEAGEYFLITVEDGKLFGESRGGKVPLVAESETSFRSPVFPVTISFVRNPDGVVDELLFNLMGLREFRARRVD